MKKLNQHGPITVDERTWFYSDSKGLDAIHEFYRDGDWLKNARLHIPRAFVESLQFQAMTHDEQEEVIKYIPAILRAELERIDREV